jgi:hypothetical protein
MAALRLEASPAVRSIGGHLTIDSSPGGSRLEITLPRTAGA